MRVRRCAHLMLELDEEPRFAFASLLSGGDGLDRSPRWRAFAAHLPAPVTIDASLLPALQAVSRDDWTTADALAERFGDATAQALLASGLLVGDDAGPDGGESEIARDAQRRDAAARDVAWWTPALVAQAHGGWHDVDIEARNEEGLTLNSEELVDAFGVAPTHDFRRVPAMSPQHLPPPRRSGFDDLLAARRTCRNFDPQAALDGAAFATMLRRVWGALGTKTLAPGAVAVKKTSPAGGGLHAVEAYVLVQRVDGVAPGLYHYLALAHALEPLQALAPDAANALAHRFVAGQHWFRDVPAMVVMVARFDRLFWKYRRHTKAWRVVHLDVGHLSQTMYLSAAELGLGAFVTAAINDRAVDAALGLPPLREAAIAIVGFGARSAETTVMELDDYDEVRITREE
ncbi:putative peptide maturation dehydrogenase [Arenimonas composti]|nr:putative peptide maturation dehydrogenase [Arenimonas composti]